MSRDLQQPRRLTAAAMGRIRRLHFVGIGGAGMSGTAEILPGSRVTLHLAIVAVAILIGYVIRKGLTGLEGLWLTDPKNAILGSFPLFPRGRFVPQRC